MRVIVFFDLPVETKKDRREYTRFRKYLIQNGFVMMQESVYSKLALNQNVVEDVLTSLRKNKPPAGLVQVLTITEKQFSRIEAIVGESKSDVVTTDERLIEL